MTDPNNPGTTPPAAPYGAAPGTPYTAPPAGPSTNILAILALVGAFVFAPAAIVLGHIALGQIKRTGEAGHQLALWGMILGYVFTGLWILIIIFSVVLPFLIVGAAMTSGSMY